MTACTGRSAALGRRKCEVALGHEAGAPGRPLRRPAHDGPGEGNSGVGDVVVFGHTALPGWRPAWARRRAGGRWYASGDQGAQPLCGGQPAGARRCAGGGTGSEDRPRARSGGARPAAPAAGARRRKRQSRRRCGRVRGTLPLPGRRPAWARRRANGGARSPLGAKRRRRAGPSGSRRTAADETAAAATLSRSGRNALSGRRPAWARRRAGGRWHASGEQGSARMTASWGTALGRWKSGITANIHWNSDGEGQRNGGKLPHCEMVLFGCWTRQSVWKHQ